MIDDNLDWYFPKAYNIAGRGENDPQKELFPGEIYQTMIRESIQNSLDHPNPDTNAPVRVEYKIRKYASSNFGSFDILREHVQSCYDISKADKFKRMLEVLNAPEIYILDVSDYNTIGMDYDLKNDNGRFKKFVRYTGDPNSVEGSGGSHGYGKITYFTISEINTIIVSSRTTDGICTFEGVARLASHPTDEIRWSYLDTGFLDKGDGCPIQDISLIPADFLRKESGTTVSIPYIDITNKPTIFKICCEAVLRNFFAAINDGKLEVFIDFGDGYEFECNMNNIEDVFSYRFFNKPPFDNVRNNVIDRFNPYPYWLAYCKNDIIITDDISDEEAINLCVGKQFICFKKSLPIIGNVSFFLSVDIQKGNDVILFMRCPRMVVGAQRNKTSRGYSAVFLCDDEEKGNKLLRNMEDAAHRTWSTRQLRLDKRPQSMIDQAENIEKEMIAFINRCLDIVFPQNNIESEDVELEEFTMPLISESDTTNPLIGNIINLQGKDEETLGAPVDIHAEKPTYKKTQLSGKAQAKNTKKVEDSDEKTDITGGEIGTGGGRRRKRKRYYKEDTEGEEKTVRVRIPVKYRVFSDVNSNGQVLYTLIIHSPRQEDKTYLTIKPVGETDDKSCNVHLLSSSVGEINENEINGVPLMEGKNVITFSVDNPGEYAFSLLAEHDITIKE